MKQGVRKSTPEQVEEMRRLWQAGLSLNEIGRRMGRDHSTIGYWVRGYRQKGEKNLTRQPISRIPLPIREQKEIPNPCPPEVIEEKIIEQEKRFCSVCKKAKEDPKWAKTNYCSLNCWEQALGKKPDYNRKSFEPIIYKLWLRKL